MKTCEIITLYQTLITHDEYGADREAIATFTNRDSALAYGKGRSAWGSDGTVEEIQAVRIHEMEGKRPLSTYQVFKLDGGPLDVDGVEKQRVNARRKELLDMLSEDDKNILGIK